MPESGTLFWDGLDATGDELPAGVYWLELSAGGRRASTKIIRSR